MLALCPMLLGKGMSLLLTLGRSWDLGASVMPSSGDQGPWLLTYVGYAVPMGVAS